MSAVRTGASVSDEPPEDDGLKRTPDHLPSSDTRQSQGVGLSTTFCCCCSRALRCICFNSPPD